ncbi:BREX-2 system adenine-specific DNA-methyltransferase PglX, partial [Streptomyces cellulosae]
GNKLIEEYFAHKVELTEVIDTSGAYIPGHGTPTVILVGKRRIGSGRSETIRTVRSVQGEPSAPEIPERGHVWRAIVAQIDDPGSVSQWVSVDDLDRPRYFGKQPWILADGGLEMVEKLAGNSVQPLARKSAAIGMTALTLEDDVFLVPEAVSSRLEFKDDCVHLINGDEVRNYSFSSPQYVVMPRTWDGRERELSPEAVRYLWPYRTNLRRRLYFGKIPEERGLRWFDLGMFFADRHREPLSISFPSVTTHNHFVLDRGGKVFKQSAPVVKLPKGASEEEHLQLLGVLNSSSACFWLKMVSHDKGIRGEGGGFTSDAWERFYDFTGTKLQEFPLPRSFPTVFATTLDGFAQQLIAVTPSTLATETTPTPSALRDIR